MDDFQEYPKALYLKGAQAIVQDEAEEAAKREEGYDDWLADHEREAKAPVIETKTYADGTTATGTAPLPDQSPDEQEQAAVLDRDALKARATELGLTFARNIKADKLAALIAAKEAE